MLYLFYGTDFKKARTQCAKFVGSLRAKRPDVAYYQFDDTTFSKEEFDTLFVSQGLFEKYIVVRSDRVLQSDEACAFFKEYRKQIVDSDNVFIFLEETISKDVESIFKKYAKKVWLCTKEKSTSLKEYPFAFTDALGERNKERAWILLGEAMRKGEAPEKLHGLLMWQLKSLLLVKKAHKEGSTSISSLGINPFVLKKTLVFSKNYSEEELSSLFSKGLRIYHEAHRGGPELSIALERFVLSI